MNQASSDSLPRISFGIIVLNGEPFLRYTLRALYPSAHEIIVVEGACRAADVLSDADGHSTDGTLETLQRFKQEEDSAGKLKIITRHGFWSEKDEMSQAYAAAATGDYLWQIDVDEFYRPEDMLAVLRMLRDNPRITAVSFRMITFWGSIDYVTDGWYLRRGADVYHRLFKWGPGYHYVTHRPPTVVDETGRDLRRRHWLRASALERRGILMYHYSLLFPHQVLNKSEYYSRSPAVSNEGRLEWAHTNYLKLGNPFRVHNVHEYPSWLERFQGSHPPQVLDLWNDVRRGIHRVQLRETEDIEQLLDSHSYRFRRALVRLLDYPARAGWLVRNVIESARTGRIRRLVSRIGIAP